MIQGGRTNSKERSATDCLVPPLLQRCPHACALLALACSGEYKRMWSTHCNLILNWLYTVEVEKIGSSYRGQSATEKARRSRQVQNQSTVAMKGAMKGEQTYRE